MTAPYRKSKIFTHKSKKCLLILSLPTHFKTPSGSDLRHSEAEEQCSLCLHSSLSIAIKLQIYHKKFSGTTYLCRSFYIFQNFSD